MFFEFTSLFSFDGKWFPLIKKKSMSKKPEFLNQKMNLYLSRENKPKEYKPEKCKSVLKNTVLNSYQMQCTLHKLQTAYWIKYEDM